jgi:arylsulfatase A-like enzyme
MPGAQGDDADILRDWSSLRVPLVFGLLAGCGGPGKKDVAPRPNILFVLVDDMGWGDLGVFFQNQRRLAANRNKPSLATPKLDTLAAEGIQLRRHYCPAPVCAPSRASLLLGVHQGHASVRDNLFDRALEKNHTLASVLKQAGYATAAFGKWGFQGNGTIPEGHPQYFGFDYFFGYMTHMNGHYHYPKEDGQAVWDGFTTDITEQLDKCYTADLWTARAKKWIVDQRSANPAQPFFVYLAYDTPHFELEIPTSAYPPGGGTSGGLQWLGAPGAMLNTAVGTVNTYLHPDYADATWDDDNDPATPEVPWPDAEKRHATMIRRLDDAVADLVQLMKDLGMDGNTLIVFTSDNGPHDEGDINGRQDPTFFDSFGPMDGIKRDTWEGGMREPALARWPGHIPTGTTTLTPSQFHDWLPTFLALAGLPAPARSDGVSLVPTLTGVGLQRASTVYVEYTFGGNTPAYPEFEPSRRGATRNLEHVVHLDGYKGVRYDVRSNSDDFQIYDTLADAKETTNLAGTSEYFIDLQRRMKDRVLQLRRPLPDAPRPFDGDLIPPNATPDLAPGLAYRAFVGNFPWVPDFTPMAAVAEGHCAGFDLGVRTRHDDIGLAFSGYLDVPADDTYTFYLITDGRAFLRIHDASVLDADFGYVGGSEMSATSNLMAGRHAIRLSYARGNGGEPALSLEWSSASFARQAIPANVLLRPAAR